MLSTYTFSIMWITRQCSAFYPSQTIQSCDLICLWMYESSSYLKKKWLQKVNIVITQLSKPGYEVSSISFSLQLFDIFTNEKRENSMQPEQSDEVCGEATGEQ